MEARYVARGCTGSPEHQAEREQAEFRRKASLNRLERRSRDRQSCRDQNDLNQPRSRSEVATRTLGAVGRITRTSVDVALREMGVPCAARKGVRTAITLASKSARAGLKLAMVASRAAARSSFHLARAGTSLAVGVLAAPVTGGTSLLVGLQEATQNLASSAQEAGRGLIQIGEVSVQGVGRITTATAQSVIPFQLRTLSNFVSGRPLSGVAQILPEPLRRAFQIVGITPGSSIAAAIRLASDLHLAAKHHGTRALEIER